MLVCGLEWKWDAASHNLIKPEEAADGAILGGHLAY